MTRLPWFDLKRPCTDCPFRKDAAPYLPAPERIADALDEDRPFFCHVTTTKKDRPGTHPDAKYCAGSLLHLEQRGKPGVHMRLAVALSLWHPDQLSRAVPVFESREAFIAHHRSEK